MFPLIASSSSVFGSPVLGMPDWLVISYLVIAGVAAIGLMACVLGGGGSCSGLSPASGDDPVTGTIYLILFAPFALAGMFWPFWLPFVVAKLFGNRRAGSR